MTLETLLNELIALWHTTWFDLYWVESVDVIYWKDANNKETISIDIFTSADWPYTYSLNDLCSIDSGLRQFVCENRIQNKDEQYSFERYNIKRKSKKLLCIYDLEYRIMLSSIQEDKEKFLLDNILLPNKT